MNAASSATPIGRCSSTRAVCGSGCGGATTCGPKKPSRLDLELFRPRMSARPVRPEPLRVLATAPVAPAQGSRRSYALAAETVAAAGPDIRLGRRRSHTRPAGAFRCRGPGNESDPALRAAAAASRRFHIGLTQAICGALFELRLFVSAERRAGWNTRSPTMACGVPVVCTTSGPGISRPPRTAWVVRFDTMFLERGNARSGRATASARSLRRAAAARVREYTCDRRRRPHRKHRAHASRRNANTGTIASRIERWFLNRSRGSQKPSSSTDRLGNSAQCSPRAHSSFGLCWTASGRMRYSCAWRRISARVLESVQLCPIPADNRSPADSRPTGIDSTFGTRHMAGVRPCSSDWLAPRHSGCLDGDDSSVQGVVSMTPRCCSPRR